MASNFVTVSPPPKRSAPSPRATAAEKRAEQAVTDLHSKRSAGLNDFAQGACFLLLGFGLRADAAAVNRFGPGIIESVVHYGDVNEEWGKKLDASAELGPIAAITLSTLPLIGQLCVNHGVIKADRLASANVVRPETLDLEAQAMLDRAHASALAEQIQAAQELFEMRRQAQQMKETMAFYADQTGASDSEDFDTGD